MKNFLLVFMLVSEIYAMQSSFDEGKNTAESTKNGIENEIKSGRKKQKSRNTKREFISVKTS